MTLIHAREQECSTHWTNITLPQPVWGVSHVMSYDTNTCQRTRVQHTLDQHHTTTACVGDKSCDVHMTLIHAREQECSTHWTNITLPQPVWGISHVMPYDTNTCQRTRVQHTLDQHHTATACVGDKSCDVI